MSNSRGRLSMRRGSVTASDPFGTHNRFDGDLQSSSRLTIVRVPPTPPHPEAPAQNLSSPRRIHRRLPSQPPGVASSTANTETPRLSFAFSTFGTGNAPGGPARATEPSVLSAPHRARPSSPHRLSIGSSPHPRLSADQLLDLVRSSTLLSFPTQSQSQSSVRSRPSSPSFTPPQSPSHTPGASSGPTPATFTPLPDNIYLPFIDRPAEVAVLISSPPSAKLFSLLAQTFPPADTTSTSDPTKWSYSQLYTHLTQSTRQHVPDDLWVLQARKAILPRSELIWERVKGALGVPPDLDIDYDNTAPFYSDGVALEQFSSALSDSSTNTDDIPDDYGRSARGHWDDWDAVLESPVYETQGSIPGSPEIPLSFSASKFKYRELEIPLELDSALPPPQDIPDRSSAVSPALLLSIEPLLVGANTAATINTSACPSANANTAEGAPLDNIQEGAEDEEDGGTLTQAMAEESFVTPQQIQGLRISTEPLTNGTLTRNASFTSPKAALLSPMSPSLPPAHQTDSSTHTSGRSGSVSRRNSGSYGFGAFRRSNSIGSIASLRSEPSSDYEVRLQLDQREAGIGPLFPSSFAGLSARPTLYNHSKGAKSYGGHREGFISASSLGGSVAGYKRLSWGAGTSAPALATSLGTVGA